MCVYSMIVDHFRDKWQPLIPVPSDPYTVPEPYTIPHIPHVPMPVPVTVPFPTISPEEIEELRKLLDRAREYDRKNQQPDCELDEKKKALKEIAEKLGVKIDFLD